MKHEEKETRLRAIFASCPDAIPVSDMNGNIIDCNQATLDMGGFASKDEVIGKNALEFIAEKDHQRACMQKLLALIEEKLNKQRAAEKMTQKKVTKWIETRVRKIEQEHHK